MDEGIPEIDFSKYREDAKKLFENGKSTQAAYDLYL